MSGIGYHTISLAKHLMETAACDITRYSVLRKIPPYLRWWGYVGTCNIPALYWGYDLVHHMATYVPLVRGRQQHVMTVYDLSSLHSPETISPIWRYRNRVELRNSIERAKGIIAISCAVRDELLEHFPSIDPKTVYVSPNGLRVGFAKSKPNEENLSAHDVRPFSYFLFIGDLTKRKNLPFLVQAFIEARKKGFIQKSTKLVLVGKRAWGYEKLRDLLREDVGIHEAGYLTDGQIISLYRYCKALVFPSVYEGFGMPIVEAMSQNAPIIVSNIATSRELNRLHGNQFLSFELGDQKGLMALLEQVDKEDQLIRSSLNYGDLSIYDYRNIAAKHIEIYSQLINKT